MRKLFVVFTLVVTAFFGGVGEGKAEGSSITIHLFGRDDCTHCSAEHDFLTAYTESESGILYEYHNVLTDKEAASFFEAIVKKHELPRVTPLTVIGAEVIQGFNAKETTGAHIQEMVARARATDIRTIEEHLLRAPKQSLSFQGSGCDESGTSCDSITNPNAYIFKLPLIGVINLKSFSLGSLSLMLGTIDGFNPCAMWVLITFLVMLSQIGDRRKMLMVAGIFIVAETVMYNLILNVWFTTWDFVGLDRIVTPLVGLLAVGGGVFFLYRYRKNRNTPLTCDISDIETQGKTTARIKDLISRPTTILTILGIIALAFSVNVIEFACSIGIPQAYTKILELNQLDFFTRQLYMFLYSVGYMVDDFIVFGLALWGFSRLEAHGHKYAQLSLLVGGILMLILGALLIFEPSLLVL